MADAIPCNSLRYSPFLTSLHTYHHQFPILLPIFHSSKLGPTIVNLSLTFRPSKRLSSFKVQGVVVEATDQPKWWEKNVGPNMIDIHSTEEFLSALKEAGDRLVVVEFYGTWCASCRALFPRLCRMAEDHPEILFIKVNFDENKKLCKSMNVKVLPYFHFYRGADGKLDEFSCSLAKFQKIRDAIKTYNPGQSDGPTKVGNDLRLDPGQTNVVDDDSSKSSNT